MVTIDGGNITTVEIGGPVNITCTGSSVYNDVTVSWIQIVDGEEKQGIYLLTAPIKYDTCNWSVLQYHPCWA